MSSCNQQECEFAPKGDAFNALDEILHDLWHGTDPSLAGIESSELQSARKELSDLRASVLPQAIVEAVGVYKEAFLRWSSDCMNMDNFFILEKVKEELMRRIEADAKGEEK